MATPWFLKAAQNDAPDDADLSVDPNLDVDSTIESFLKTASRDELGAVLKKMHQAKKIAKHSAPSAPHGLGRDRFHIVRARTKKPCVGAWITPGVPQHSWYFIRVENAGFDGAAQCEMCYRDIQFTYRISHTNMGNDEPLYTCEYCAAWAIRDGPDADDDN